MVITEGKNYSRKNKSIIDIEIDEYLICVFEGRLSTFDILIKYREDDSMFRTPKHMHWVIDLLLKRENKHKLTVKYVNYISKVAWENANELNRRDYNEIKEIIEKSYCEKDLTQFLELNKYGQYKVSFLTILLILLSVQEKTNNSKAYVLGNLLTKLSDKNIDIYSIVNLCNFRGR